ncbi:MAG: TetR/AcrR family transcriptional regulator, partial [Mycobacterium sp.]|nr:TetR/AcrR family transcriptional regulator [Mycobacterium sp.]
GTFSDDPDDVEARGMLAFSLAIGSHFIAAEHDGRTRPQVLQTAIQRLLA